MLAKPTIIYQINIFSKAVSLGENIASGTREKYPLLSNGQTLLSTR